MSETPSSVVAMPDEAPGVTRTPSSAPYPRTAQAWWTITVLLLLNIASCLDRQILALMVDDVKADLLVSDFQISLLQGMTFALFYTVFGLPFGWAADRFPRRWLIFAGVTAWSIAASACGLAQNFWQLMLARVGVGVGEASLSPAAFSLLSDTFPKHRLAFALSIYSTGAVIGAALALAIGGLLVGVLPDAGVMTPVLGHLAKWQVVYVVTGLPCILVGWLIFTIVDPVRRGRISQSAVKATGALQFMAARWRFFGPHFVGFGLYSLCGYGIMLWSPAYMHRVFGWDMLVVGPTLAMVMLTGVFGGSALGAIVDRLFARGRTDAHLRVYAVVALVQPFIVAFAILMNNPYVFLVSYGAYHLMSSFTGVSTAALQIVTPNQYRGQISASFLLVFNLLGLGLGATVVAALTSFVFHDPRMVGWSIVLTFAVLGPITAALFASAFRPMRDLVAAAAD
jgi:MFS family permease